MQERLNRTTCQGWQQIRDDESHLCLKYYSGIVTVLLITCVIFITALLVDDATNQWFIKENGLVETLSAIGYLIAVAIMLKMGSLDYVRQFWYFPFLLLAFAMREMDFDKKFTEVGILKSKFILNPHDSVMTKVIALAIILFILYAAFNIVRSHVPGFLVRVRLKMMTPIDWSVGLGVAFLFISKSIDGLGRKLGGLGIEVSKEMNGIAAHLEESLEWAIPFLFIVAVITYFSQQKMQRSAIH